MGTVAMTIAGSETTRWLGASPAAAGKSAAVVKREAGHPMDLTTLPTELAVPTPPQNGPAPDCPAPGAAAAKLSPERAAALAEQAALAALAARCQAGDGAAWEELARTQHRRIYGICYRFTGSPTESEDMTQDVFIKVFRNLSNFDPAKGGFTTWLTTLTRNMLVDNYRRSKLDRATDSLDESADAEGDGPTRLDRLADGGRSQEQHVAGLQLRGQIQDALKQVSPELREAVILRDLEDMDYKDIADVLGVPVGTVKSRISRGRGELAKLLKNLEGQVM
jgi:RNA polymerase sigma-70 factor (ECF subfamily)